MQSQTLKRQAEDVSFNNDHLDDEYDVTWGSKRSRYLYTYNLQSPDLFSNINDSDETESVYSIQSKATIEIADELNSAFEISCGDSDDDYDTDCNDCDSQNSSQSDSSEHKVAKHITLLGNDEYSHVDTDFRETTPETTLLIPVFFKTCLQCYEENPDPHYQYCVKCFKYRKQLFKSKPKSKQKKKNQLNAIHNYSKESSLKDSQEYDPTLSQESGSFGISGLWLSQESTTDTFENPGNLCNVCFLKPKNGVFNHGNTAHVYCCYTCAKKIWYKNKKCPICGLKIRYVIKTYYSS